MASRLCPPRLQPGMTIGIVAPSSPADDHERIAQGVATLESLGFHVIFGDHVLDRHGHFAGRDADRADDLLAMLLREDVDGVWCLCGGVGAMRTALALDPVRIAEVATHPPKAFIGFSDITMLHGYLGAMLGWVTFYGPMLTNLIPARLTAYNLDGIRRALMESEAFNIAPSHDGPMIETIVPGVVEGEIVGGCLPSLNILAGTPWAFDLRGRILFVEAVHADAGSIDNFFVDLLGKGQLQQCAGIVIGECFECGTPESDEVLSVRAIIKELVKPLGVPTLYNLPIGHGRHHATIPIGVHARLDATAGTLRILEPGVR